MCATVGILGLVGIVFLAIAIKARQQRNYPQPDLGAWLNWFWFVILTIAGSVLAWLLLGHGHPIQASLITLWTVFWIPTAMKLFIIPKTIATAAGRYGTVLHPGAFAQGGGMATSIWTIVFVIILISSI